MGLRETINEKTSMVTIALLVLIAGAVALTIHSVMPSNPLDGAFFTTDDGQTTFAGKIDDIPPFNHHGQPAVRAWMFTCDGGKTKFLGYLERYTSGGKAKMESGLADYKSGKTHVAPSPGPEDLEVKKPGTNNVWVSRNSHPLADQITKVNCDNGGTLDLAMP
ncbi:MAG TPA: hypothetical protein VGG19_15260 [Tepidisphaeraceae bacterium]|jgi:hypothetical protein